MNNHYDIVEDVVATFESLYTTIGDVAGFDQSHLQLATVSLESCAGLMNCDVVELVPCLAQPVVSMEDLREDLWKGAKAGAKAIWDGLIRFIEWVMDKIKGSYRRLKNGLGVVKQSLKRRIAERKGPSKEDVDNLNISLKGMQKDRAKKVETGDTEWVLRSEKNKHNFGMIKKPSDINDYIQLMTTTAERIIPVIPDSKDVEKFLNGLIPREGEKPSDFALNTATKSMYRDLGLDKMTTISLPDPMTLEYDKGVGHLTLRDRSIYFSGAGKSSSGKLDFSDVEMLKIIETAESALQSRVFERAYETLDSYKKILKENIKRLEDAFGKNGFHAPMNIRLIRSLLRSSVDVALKPLHAVEDLVKAIHSAENTARNVNAASGAAKDIDKE